MSPEQRQAVALEIIKIANEVRILGFEHGYGSEKDEAVLVAWARGARDIESGCYPVPSARMARDHAVVERGTAKLTGGRVEAYRRGLADLYERVADLLEPPSVAEVAAREKAGGLGPNIHVEAHGGTSALVGASTSLRLFPSGTLFTPFSPRPQDIHIEDVAHGLACINRFGGHLAEPYNVAHHSLIVSEFCPEEPLWALLHEVAEALSGLGDVCGPTKRHPSIRGPVKDLERRIERAAAERFGLPEGFAASSRVKAADLIACAWEDRDLRGSTNDDAWVAAFRGNVPQKRLVPMSWREAEAAFLARFELLTSRAQISRDIHAGAR